MTCGDCNGSKVYQPLFGKAEPCRLCAGSGVEPIDGEFKALNLLFLASYQDQHNLHRSNFYIQPSGCNRRNSKCLGPCVTVDMANVRPEIHLHKTVYENGQMIEVYIGPECPDYEKTIHNPQSATRCRLLECNIVGPLTPRCMMYIPQWQISIEDLECFNVCEVNKLMSYYSHAYADFKIMVVAP